jgi:phage terminase large subunit-like protein
MNKVIRMNTVTSMIECGFVHVPDKGAYLAEYLHELADFPNAKHDNKSSTAPQHIFKVHQFEIVSVRLQ